MARRALSSQQACISLALRAPYGRACVSEASCPNFERGVLSEFRAARTCASYWFDKSRAASSSLILHAPLGYKVSEQVGRVPMLRSPCFARRKKGTITWAQLVVGLGLRREQIGRASPVNPSTAGRGQTANHLRQSFQNHFLLFRAADNQILLKLKIKVK